VDAPGQDDAGGGRLERRAQAAVVARDRLHAREQHRRGEHDDPRSLRELRDEHDHEHHRGRRRAQRVHRLLAPQGAARSARGDRARPVPHHAALAQREREEHAEDVELDQTGDLGIERHDQERRDGRKQQHAVREDEPVAAVAELMRQVLVAAEQRRPQREPVEGGVGGEDEDRGRERLQQVEGHCRAEDCEPDLAQRGLLLRARR
jgi:hypothetical protein